MILSIFNPKIGLPNFYDHVIVCHNISRSQINSGNCHSCSILIQSTGTCCIADFGLAHKHTVVPSGQDKPVTAKIGTRRYQAPEILDNKINVHWFDAFRKADIYAFALCLWEVCRRTEIEGMWSKEIFYVSRNLLCFLSF